MTNALIVYTDGSCLGNPGPGGYAWAIMKPDGTVLDQDAVAVAESTTNNRMELMGAIDALRALVSLNANLEWVAGSVVEMRLDSQYVLGEMFDYRDARRAKNFSGIKNVDIVRALHDAMVAAESAGFVLRKVWVKGHAADAGNNMVDGAANAAAQRAQEAMAAQGTAQGTAPFAQQDRPTVVLTHLTAKPFDAPFVVPGPTATATVDAEPPAVATPSADSLSAARMLLLLARDPATTPEDFLREIGHMKNRLGV